MALELKQAAKDKRCSPKAVWDFTLWLPAQLRSLPDPLPSAVMEMIDLLKRHLKETCKKWCFQLERVDAGLHFQGRLQMKTKKRKATLVNEWKASNPFLGAAHFSPTHDVGTFNYVMKDETRVLGPFSNEFQRYSWMEEIWTAPRPFQRALQDLPFDRRRVYFVHNPEGGAGKTMWSLTQLAASEQRWPGARLTAYMPEWSDMRDFRRAIHGQVKNMDRDRFTEGVQLLVDLPRVMPSPKVLREMIAGLEQLKNGWIREDRYSHQSIQLDTTKLIVFHNWALPQEADFWNLLSADRWVCYFVSDEFELVKTWPVEPAADDPLR